MSSDLAGKAASARTAGTVAGEDRRLRRVSAASFVGTLVEFYDVNIYATCAALVFPQVFFPQLGRAAGTIAAFGTVGVAFVARPIGSLLFGHFGDKLGRKRTLIVSLLLMGISTILVGLLPTGAQIGIAAPLILVTLRFAQGLAAGGEYGGAVLLAAEYAPPHRRGVYSSMPARGGAFATSLAGLSFFLVSASMSPASFLAWGWRIPFLASVALLAVGLYIRLKIEETPVFAEATERHGVARVPVAEAFRNQGWTIVKCCMLEVPSFALLYLNYTYVVDFGSNVLHLGYTRVLGVTVASGVLMLIGILAASTASDRIGRRPVLLFANCCATVWAFCLVPVLHHGTIAAYAICVIVSMLIAGLIFGPIGATLSEAFETRYRYTAVGLCYNMAGIVGGALPPLVAGSIIVAYGDVAFGGLLSLLCLVSVICGLRLPETRGRSLEA